MRGKSPIERFFRTLREGLLEALPGYKGPDVFSRGKDAEQDAFFYLGELEAIIREWVASITGSPMTRSPTRGCPGWR
jgi:hypothetical protein